MAHESIGVFVIVRNIQNGKILLGKRKNCYLSGSWGFPGGRLEKIESLISCASRELLEETGLKGNTFQYLGVIRELQGSKDEKGYNFIHFAYLCLDYKGKPEVKEPDKCEEWRWFDADNVPELMIPGHRCGIDFLKNPQGSSLRDLI